MKLLVSGHRLEKLAGYDTEWIRQAIHDTIGLLREIRGLALAYSGMASGVDLWFCQACLDWEIPYHACVPFEEQGDLMDEASQRLRKELLSRAAQIRRVKNTWMVQNATAGLIVWDGNKGGTHNVLQQMLEAHKPFWWLIPQQKKWVEV